MLSCHWINDHWIGSDLDLNPDGMMSYPVYEVSVLAEKVFVVYISMQDG